MTATDTHHTGAPQEATASVRESVALEGCRPAPLGSYLQGLGVWHAVTRLLDPQALACWQSGRLVLTTNVGAEALARVLTDKFTPLPIVSPWNAGSGFAGNGKSKEAERALAAVSASSDPRLASLRKAVAAGHAVVAEGRARGWSGKGDKLWDDAAKAHVVQLCRNLLPDESLAWIDAAVSTTQDSSGDASLEFNRLLGTGGNFGRQDLQSTYIQRALTVLTDVKAQPNNLGWIRAVLCGEEGTPYLREAVGQFDPGRAGGIQSSPAEKADSEGFANPWAFLFMIEGALFFAGAATRRLGIGTVNASLPFVVRPSSVGYGSSAEDEKTMAEIWAPQWTRPATLAETRQLFSQARINWTTGTARSGVDVARAIVSGGVDRGIARFERHLIAERHGQNPLAVHVDSIPVRRRPGVALTAQLDPWLQNLRRLQAGPGGLPQAITASLRAVHEALYECSAQDGRSLAQVLTRVSRLHQIVARSGRLRAVIRPLVLSAPGEWIAAICAEQSPSMPLRLAVALASGWNPTGSATQPHAPGGPPARGWHPSLRLLLTPVAQDGGRLTWSGAPPVIPDADITSALAEAHRRRAMLRLPDLAVNAYGGLTPAVQGRPTSFTAAVLARLFNVEALRRGPTSTDRWSDEDLAEFLHAFLLFRWTTGDHAMIREIFAEHPYASQRLIPPASLLMLLVPFYARAPLHVRWTSADLASKPVLLRPDAAWPSQLAAGHLDRVAQDAARRLRISGARNVIDPVVAALPLQEGGKAGANGRRLAAALLVPVSDQERAQCLIRVTDAVRASGRRPAAPLAANPEPELSDTDSPTAPDDPDTTAGVASASIEE